MTALYTLKERTMPVHIPLDEAALHGDLQVPDDARGLVIFVHGSGSSRFSPRNRRVAKALNDRGLATLLLDLLSNEEQRIDAETMQFRFDIPLLAARSTLVAAWAEKHPDLGRLPIGLFGASTGAAAALITAAALGSRISAVVSRGGRPDLAAEHLREVKAPTLLIVGGSDRTVLELNRKAMERMQCVTRLHVVPGATHLFEEQGALEEVTKTAAEWFADAFTERRQQAAS
ncbi:MAG: dienelactone hydrolase family protein [Actinomycetota bacterium]